MPLSDSLERGWGEFETNKSTLCKLVLLIFRTVDFSEWTHYLNAKDRKIVFRIRLPIVFYRKMWIYLSPL